MIAKKRQTDTGFGVGILISTVIHLAVFLLLFWFADRAVQLVKEETYYVDVVNLPVSDPQGGSPTQKGNDTPAPPPPPTPSEMALPTPPKPVKAAVVKPQVNRSKPPTKGAESSSEFSERMAKLQKKQEAQQEEVAIARLREKIKGNGSGKAGMPTGTGKEVGSDYLAYLQSRLKDAFVKTISYTVKKPEAIVRIFIDTNGKVTRIKFEKSNDSAFQLSVRRAIDMAAEKFPPPPNKKMFEGVFMFKPEGISQSKP